MTAPRLGSRWSGLWDRESELLILTLASTVLAGAGLAMIMMGALPDASPAVAARGPAEQPAVGRLTAPVPPTGRAGSPTPARSQTPARSTAPGKPTAAGQPTAAGRSKAPVPMSRSVPLTLDIPVIDVHTSLISLGLNPDRTIALPPLRHDAPAGWYKYLSTPGEIGPAVILGHVDSARDGPAVFYRLRQLRPGDQVSVGRADGSIAVFTVRSIARYPKDHFPTDAVYGPLPTPELHLITCGGSFDTLRHHYRDNIVAYAQLTGTRPALLSLHQGKAG